jgi:hypothetical protein
MKRGGVCLFSPFFCWTPSRYKSVADPSVVVALLREEPDKNQLFHDAISAASIRGRLDAGILDPRLLVGPDRTGLGSFFAIARNAEHDEAVSLLNALPSSGESIHNVLAEHANAPVGNSASLEERLYRQTRLRYSSLLQRALRTTDKNSFQELLVSVRDSPLTALTRAE